MTPTTDDRIRQILQEEERRIEQADIDFNKVPRGYATCPSGIRNIALHKLRTETCLDKIVKMVEAGHRDPAILQVIFEAYQQIASHYLKDVKGGE